MKSLPLVVDARASRSRSPTSSVQRAVVPSVVHRKAGATTRFRAHSSRRELPGRTLMIVERSYADSSVLLRVILHRLTFCPRRASRLSCPKDHLTGRERGATKDQKTPTRSPPALPRWGVPLASPHREQDNTTVTRSTDANRGLRHSARKQSADAAHSEGNLTQSSPHSAADTTQLHL